MPAPLTQEEVDRRVDAIRKHVGNTAEAARELGLHPDTLWKWYNGHKVKRSDGKPPPIQFVPPPDYPGPDPEQRPTVRVRVKNDNQGKYRVVAIGDAHDSPHIPDKSRFRWLGCYARDQLSNLPEGTTGAVVGIGDWQSVDSLFSHEPNGTLKGRAKPSFMEDMESGELAYAAFDEGFADCLAEKHLTLGNHEDRVWSFENRTPEMDGRLQFELDRLLARHGWTYSPYGVPYFIGGVAFCHVPLNVMSKPVGGTIPSNIVSRDATYDWVYGHTHVADVHRRRKIGPNNHVTAINLGCALPQGHIEEYAKVATQGWWWGAWTLEIERGRIQSYSNATMQQLEERYG